MSVPLRSSSPVPIVPCAASPILAAFRPPSVSAPWSDGGGNRFGSGWSEAALEQREPVETRREKHDVPELETKGGTSCK